MKNTERGAYNAIKNATSASQAAALIDKYYERSDGTARQSRMNAAEQAYSQFGNGTSAPVNNGTSVGQIGQNPTNNSTPSSPQSNTSAPSTDGLTQPSSDQSSKDDVERADPGPQKATSGKSESKSKDKTYAESPKYNPKTKQNPNSPGGDGGGSDKKASTSKSSGEILQVNLTGRLVLLHLNRPVLVVGPVMVQLARLLAQIHQQPAQTHLVAKDKIHQEMMLL